MSSPNCDLLTGATGFLGSYLLRDALVAGRRVAVVVRRTRDRSPEQRVDELLERFRQDGSELATLPTVFEGDLCRPDLGLDEAARGWIGEHCDRVVHCAASLTFHAKGGEPYRSNVDGTRYLLALCETSGILDFNLVSTAYVCGGRTGRVLEGELDQGQEFANDYERSKFLSETLVRQATFLDRWTVFRPSVIVGDSVTGFASSDDGLYAFLRLARLIEGMDHGEVFGHLGISAADRPNLVPVDWVSAAITYLLEHPGGVSTTYHLTHPTPAAAAEILEATSGLSSGAPRVPLQALNDLLNTYRPYLTDHCVFDRTNLERDVPLLPCPPLQGDVLDRLARFVTERQSALAPERSSSGVVALAVGGPEGGLFDITVPTSAREIGPEGMDDAVVRMFCAPETLDRLVGVDMTVEEAIYAGLLALEGDTPGFQHALGLLESYLTEGPSVPAVGEGGA